METGRKRCGGWGLVGSDKARGVGGGGGGGGGGESLWQQRDKV